MVAFRFARRANQSQLADKDNMWIHQFQKMLRWSATNPRRSYFETFYWPRWNSIHDQVCPKVKLFLHILSEESTMVAMLQITSNRKQSSSKAKTFWRIFKYADQCQLSGNSQESTLASTNATLSEILKAHTQPVSSISREFSSRFLFVE